MAVKLDCVAMSFPFLVLWGTLGCASATANGTPQSVRIAVRESTVPLERAVGAASFAVTVVARNDGPLPIYLSQCMWEAQRLIGKDWVTIYRPICPGTDSFDKLAAGDSIVFPIRVSAYDSGAPALDANMTSGEYRLTFGIGVGKSPLENLHDRSVFVAVTSSPFFLKE